MIGDKPSPSFKEASLFWLKLGFISFGGPAGQIALMHEFLVEKKKWLSESKFLHALNYCMLLPGPEAQQLATYSGWLLHGVKGGLVAGILFILPSVFILLGLSIVYALYGDLPYVYAVINGLKPAVIAIVILALIRIGKRSLKNVVHYVVAIMSFIAIAIVDIPFPLIILSALITGLLMQKFFSGTLRPDARQESKEIGFEVNSDSVNISQKKRSVAVIKQLFLGLILWVLPFCIIFLTIKSPVFWYNLSMFFTKAALVTFGGAYAILPYVAQVSVNDLNWLTDVQMMDGLALGETTPGPLIMVLAFVGFMAGYNRHLSVLSGMLGLSLAVWFTFLPSFLFVFIGAPLIERTHDNLKIKYLLEIINAAVVGLILHLTFYLFKTVDISASLPLNPLALFNVAWIILSIVFLTRFKVGIVAWILISALAGLGYYLAFS